MATRHALTPAPLPARPRRPRLAQHAQDGGLAARIAVPADALALPGRAALGALLAASSDLAGAPAALAVLLAAPGEVEGALAAAVDKGVAAEAALRALLPEPLRTLLPPLPPPPTPSARPVNPLVTFSPGPPRVAPAAAFGASLAANKLGAELQLLTREVGALRAALAACVGPEPGSLKLLGARDARSRLARRLSELGAVEAEAAAAVAAARALAAAADALPL